METLDAEACTDAALERLRKRLGERSARVTEGRYAAALRGSDLVQQLATGTWPLQWTSAYQFVADDPAKVMMKKRDVKRTHVGVTLLPMLNEAQQRVSIVSPYFVPGDGVTESLTRMVKEGKAVRILTNSLVANDVAAVHGGYSRYRKPLVEGGVQLWELKPAGGEPDSSLLGSSGASLHTKAFAVDGRKLFVGSYNLDPRSTWLNCEQGVLVEDKVLGVQLEALFDRQVNAHQAWRVSLEDGDLVWSDGNETFDHDPKASGWQRFQAWLTRVLHLDAQL
jgi:putative cardiolipin synthase